MLNNVRVVLVNTSHPGNIGGAARAMKNMGLNQLVLVDPVRFPDPDANSRASGADDVLANARAEDADEMGGMSPATVDVPGDRAPVSGSFAEPEGN